MLNLAARKSRLSGRCARARKSLPSERPSTLGSIFKPKLGGQKRAEGSWRESRLDRSSRNFRPNKKFDFGPLKPPCLLNLPHRVFTLRQDCLFETFAGSCRNQFRSVLRRVQTLEIASSASGLAATRSVPGSSSASARSNRWWSSRSALA